MEPLSATFSSPIGNLGIYCKKNQLLRLDFLSPQHPILQPKTKFDEQVIQQFNLYFNNEDHLFDVLLNVTGTLFQKRVWQALQNISPGKTLTYGALAQQLKTSPRAIGNACRANPIPIIIPCHRIVGKHSLGGFSGQRKGSAMRIKTWLLNHELSMLDR